MSKPQAKTIREVCEYLHNIGVQFYVGFDAVEGGGCMDLNIEELMNYASDHKAWLKEMEE